MTLRKKIHQFVNKLYLFYWILKCKWLKLIEGGDGLTRAIEQIPKMHIIPVLKKLGFSIGDNCQIQRGLTLHYLTSKESIKNLTIGNNVYIGRNVLIDLASKVVLEDDSALGAGSQIWTHLGDYTYDFTDYHESKKPVRIGKAVLCWARVIISPGVSLGKYSRVGAGSVVVRDIPEKTFYAGIPAKLIKSVKW